uniref:Uncharacterized protein n=1 Tax=Ixodes ricinus TaxID=34613 RepID=A0A6B0TY25_IXORI
MLLVFFYFSSSTVIFLFFVLALFGKRCYASPSLLGTFSFHPRKYDCFFSFSNMLRHFIVTEPIFFFFVHVVITCYCCCC